MNRAVCTSRFLQYGKPAPPGSRFKGILTTYAIFGKNGFFDYTGREDANHKRIDEENEHKSFFDYTGREMEKVDDDLLIDENTFTNYGLLDDVSREIFRDEAIKYFNKDGDIIWDLVISHRDYETTKKIGLNNINDYGNMLSRILPTIFKKLEIENNNVMWWANYHTNTKRPHVHLVFFEKDKTRSRGKLTQTQLQLIKDVIDKETMKMELSNNSFKETYKNLLNNKNETKNILINKVKEMDLKLFTKVQNLFIKLPEKGRLQYNSIHIKPYRKEVDDIVKDILENDFIKDSYQNFVTKIDELNEITKESNEEFDYKIKDVELRKIHILIANYLLSLKKQFNYMNDMDDRVTDNNSYINPETSEAIDDENINDSTRFNNIYDDEYKLGMKYLYGSKEIKKDNLKAYEIMYKKSLGNNPLAMQNLAKLINKYPSLNKNNLDYAELLNNSYKIILELYKKTNSNLWAYKLGKFHHYDLGIDNVNYEKSMEYYKKSENYSFSKIALGNLYENGLGVERDYEKAFKYYSEVKEPNPLATYKIAEFMRRRLIKFRNINFMQDCYKEVFECLESKNNKGEIDTNSKIILAKLYENGLGTEINYEKATKIYAECLRELDISNPDLKIRLANILLKNKVQHEFNTKENINKLLDEAQKELLDNFNKYPTKESSLKLSKLYFFGNLGEVNYDLALYYAKKFELTNNKDLNYLASILDKQNNRECLNIIKILVDRGDPEANYRLGVFYLVGKYVERDLNYAKKYIEAAKSFGYEKAAKFDFNPNRIFNSFIKSNTTFKHNLFHKAKGSIGKNTKEIEEEIERYLNMNRGYSNEYS
ncbi:MAG: relaxase MobL [Erysipelotrichaceae bacterium]|nr:relaxase MobL [Erysipelotrichaceae bacterium]